MRRMPFAATAAAMLLISSAALAQTKPNFAGKWKILPDSGAPVQQQGMRGGANMGGLGELATIAQDEKTVSITRNATQMGDITSVFNLDGSPTNTSINTGNGDLPLTLTAKWDGTKLHTTTSVNVQGQSFDIILVMWIDDKGMLVTEHTFPSMGNNGGGTTTTKYAKQP